MGSAQLDFVPEGESDAGAEQARPALSGGSDLRREVAERLAAHRRRRQRPAEAGPQDATPASRSPKHRVAAAVAERYAQTPSYRAFLAEQAKRAIQEAAAAAEVAMRNAEAVAAAQQELLGELELWDAPQEFTAETAVVVSQAPALAAAPVPVARAQVKESQPAGLTVRLYEDLRQIPPPAPISANAPRSEPDLRETQALDAEIAFRQAPVFEEFWLHDDPLEPIPANLLEFPRQLVAARKARPRLAEGPLREEITPRTAQLRIFEVEPEQISTAPTPVPAAPDWASSIHLDAQTPVAAQTAPDAPAIPMLASLLPPQTAPLELRFMSGLVDGILVAGGALAFVTAYAKAGGEIPLGLSAVGAIFAILVVVHVLYQLLFFTFSDQTPGMRYARIGLCTFADDNPTRAQMRRRILAQFIAICPLGIGLLWIVLDDDGLGWHDRISRMYQRAY
jgi:uncharacterized RDD family membrane protein YckC